MNDGVLDGSSEASLNGDQTAKRLWFVGGLKDQAKINLSEDYMHNKIRFLGENKSQSFPVSLCFLNST